MAHTIVDMMGTTMQKLREMVDVNTIIGQPISTPDGVTIIPVSKLSFGFAAGGADYSGKDPTATPNFGGGGGAGVNINPIAFLVIHGQNVKLLSVNQPASSSFDRVVEMVPQIMEKVQEMLNANKKEEISE